MHHVFRPSFGRVLTVFVGGVAGGTLVVLLATAPATALRAAPVLALAAGACWALFWRPAIEVDDGGVRVVNPLRTIDLPWPSILAVDTKFALTLVSAYGRYTAWAAPAPGPRGGCARDQGRGDPPPGEHVATPARSGRAICPRAPRARRP